MSYKRFFREAEPYKISACDNCGTSLRRSRKVYLFLFLMILPLCMIVLAVLFSMANARTSFWIIFPIIILMLAAWAVLTNYLAWRFIGWVLVAKNN